MQIFNFILPLLLISLSEAGPLKRDAEPKRPVWVRRDSGWPQPEARVKWPRQFGLVNTGVTTTTSTTADLPLTDAASSTNSFTGPSDSITSKLIPTSSSPLDQPTSTSGAAPTSDGGLELSGSSSSEASPPQSESFIVVSFVPNPTLLGSSITTSISSMPSISLLSSEIPFITSSSQSIADQVSSTTSTTSTSSVIFDTSSSQSIVAQSTSLSTPLSSSNSISSSASIASVLSSTGSSLSSTHYRATGAVNAQVPTAITSLPTATTTLSPADYRANVDRARELNVLYSNLTETSACTGGQAACIDRKVARCRPDGSYNIISCPTGTDCFAMPLENAPGVLLDCVDRSTAGGILGALLPPSSSEATGGVGADSTTSAEDFSSTTTLVKDGSGFTLTVTVTETSGAAQSEAPSATGEGENSGRTTSSSLTEPIATTSRALESEPLPSTSDTSIFITKSFASNSVVLATLPPTTTVTVVATATYTVPAS